MQATRRARLQSVIQEELSMIVPRELKDPRIPSVTFTSVEVTADGSFATVFVSILGVSSVDNTDEKAERKAKAMMRDALDGLTSASGFLRRHLASVLNIRHVPNLVFKEDKGLANASRVYDLLKKIEGEKKDEDSGA